MAHEHDHEHPHHHHGDEGKLPELPLNEFDPGSKSLAEALRISFIVLKVIMVLLVAAFLASGVFRVPVEDRAIVLRLGKIHGVGEDATKGAGWYWSLPVVDEVIRIPVTKVQELIIDDFWYFETEQEKLGQSQYVDPGQPLIPQRDGYVITRNDRVEGISGNDYNIVHCKWRLKYRISSPLDFFRNVYIDQARPGEDFYDVAGKTVNPLLRSIAEKAIVATMVDYTIDEALVRSDGIAVKVKELMSRELADMRTGIVIDDKDGIKLERVTWPRQVDAAFQDLIGARQQSEQGMSVARGAAEQTLNEAGGPVTTELLTKLMSGPDVPDTLWDQLAGEAQKVISEARAYRTKVVEDARANAEYMQSLLPEYRKRPALVMQKIYQDAIEEVMAAADEKIFAQRDPGAGKSSEVRVMINSNPVKEKKSQTK